MDKALKKLIEDELIICNEAGEWIFWPTRNQGAYTADNLRVISEYLYNLNENFYRSLEYGTRHLANK